MFWAYCNAPLFCTKYQCTMMEIVVSLFFIKISERTTIFVAGKDNDE